MLILDESLLLGRRQTRDTFRHPHDPRYVLKLETRPRPRRTKWYQRSIKVPPSAHRELDGYADMLKRLGRHEPYICRILGLEQTDRGPAVLAENATLGVSAHINLRDLIKHREPHPFTGDDVAWAKEAYRRIAEEFQARGIYNQTIRPENVMLCRVAEGGDLCLRLYDFKSLVYRQLISPRLVPGAQRYEQGRVIKSTLDGLENWISQA